MNRRRLERAPGHRFSGASWSDAELRTSPWLKVDYIVAVPRMALYMKRSSEIYKIYLKYVAPEDIHVYSIDEVFIDATSYLKAGGLTAEQLASRMIRDVFQTTGITATAGIGPNLYLCKVAMDIEAKHSSPDADGVRIASLDEESYRRRLWNHRPLTDFWRVGAGYARRLEERGLFTMGDIARCSLGKAEDYYNEDLLYRMFGVNAELLIDHAWGWEPCTMADIKAYRPEEQQCGVRTGSPLPVSLGEGQAGGEGDGGSPRPELVDKGLVTDQLVLTVGYDRENLTDSESGGSYRGEIRLDRYGRKVPVHAHGTLNLDRPTSSSRKLTESAVQLFEQITDPQLLVRRINIVANRAVSFRSRWSSRCLNSWICLQIMKNSGGMRLRRRRKWRGKKRCRKPCSPSRKSLAEMPSSRG